MGRAPCCDKVGLKKGPWTPEEDQILVSFIHQHGHSNWRALPKQAGLLRCGKSCRLRWINYLKPDIKRGNFSKEEEDTIIQLHEMMGNRWSAIAGRLPGRTDNEIKNVWHTHLKKRLRQHDTTTKSHGSKMVKKHCDKENVMITSSTSNLTSSTTTNNLTESSGGTRDRMQNSSQQSFSSDDFSSVTEVSSVEQPNNNNNSSSMVAHAQNFDTKQEYDIEGDLPIIDETFWSAEDFDYEEMNMESMFSNIAEDNQVQLQEEINISETLCYNDFWLDVFVRAGGAPDLPEL